MEREIKKNYDKKIKTKWGPQEECFIRDTPALLIQVYLRRSLFWQLGEAKEEEKKPNSKITRKRNECFNHVDPISFS